MKINWKIDNNRPIYIQLLEQLKIKIVSGEIPIGSKIESVRNLAQDAEVNPNTMQKALAELEREGLVFSKRTSGRYVTDDKEKIEKIREEMANIHINSLKETLKKLGYKQRDIIEIIKEKLEEE